MEERRLLVAVGLSLLVLAVYSWLFPGRPPEPVPRATASPAVASPAAASLGERPDRAEPSEALAGPISPVATASVADSQERRVEVVGRHLSLAFTNRGARLLSWQLSEYKDLRGRPEEMVQTVPGAVRPLDVETGDPRVDARLREALFLSSAEVLSLEGAEKVLRFEFAEGSLEAWREYRFRPDNSTVSVSSSVKQSGRELRKLLLWGPGIGNPSAAEKAVQGYTEPQVTALVDGDVERHAAKQLEKPHPLARAGWLGVEGQYFVALWVPAEREVSGEARAVTVGEGETRRPEAVAAVDLGTGTGPVELYVGPKEHDRLSGLGRGLSRVVPVGDWIGPIVVALMGALRWVNRHVGNYGWSIIAITVVINVLMAPLRHYSISNSLKMAKLSPEMKVIQERYRKIPALDPRRQEMQKEIAALYARHGMSMGTQMMVGCLPLLITMPFLIAFYRVLSLSIDLRGASFLWIPDLSQKDPWFLTPLLMGVSMFLMQKMMPSTMDAAQQRMMMIMPLVLTVMFFAAPAGLNLYWLASNVCSIAQQGLTMQLLRDGGSSGKERRRS